MRSTLFAVAAALAAREVASHATFQDLWINGVDQGEVCVRMPPSNSPVTSVTSDDIRCNVNGANGVAGRCAVQAGDTVTVEMHQQPGDRSCSTEAIGGDHYGPIHVYMSKVSDARTADGSTGWFKIYEDTWASTGASSTGSTDDWGTVDMNACCGHVDVKIPTDIEAGDYLLRAEVIALHVASSVGGAQFYMSCYQLTVGGGGSASPALVDFPGAYGASDPGILINIYEYMSTYADPGPTLYSGGSSKSAGSPCTGYAASETPGATVATAVPYVPGSGSGAGSSAAGGSTAKTTAAGSTPQTTAASAPSSTAGSGSTSGCTVQKYGQCGGTNWEGCKTCVAGTTCTGSGYYYQCS